jgi:hypothetical protein
MVGAVITGKDLGDNGDNGATTQHVRALSPAVLK